MSPRSSRIEALEARRVLAAPTLADFPAEINIAAGAPVHLALGGQDADGDSLTYTVSSTNSAIGVSIPKQDAPNGNRSMRITVQGYGEMVFELFEGRAPNTTSRIIEIAESDWYNDRIFHRVIDGFMIQGGSRDGQGINGTGIQFDDEYDADLQFTTSGLLAMAKSGDDTNDSQFFITDIPVGGFSVPRWLDFNHTIFGKMTAGASVRDAISAAATDSNNRPTGSSIVIESVEIFQDNQDAVMMIAAPHGTYESGNVTVTVSDGKGGTASKTVLVNVLPDNQNSTPFLGPIDPIRLTVDQPYSFQLDATDVEGDKIFYKAELLTETDDITVEVTEDGLVTIVPKNEVVGVAEIAFRVGPTAASLVPDSLGKYDEAVIDTQVFTIEIPPAKPTIGFASGSDTGVQDGSTGRDNSDGKELYFKVENLQATSQLAFYLQGVETPYEQITRIPQGDGSTNYVATIRVLTGAELDDGDYTLHVQQLLPLGSAYGNQNLVSDLSDPFEFSIDTEPPVITSAAVDIAIQGEEYLYDVDSDEEGDPDVYYQIDTPIPDGMVINSQTGEISWTPTSSVGFQQPVVILAVDGAGNLGRQEYSITVYAPLEISVEGDQTVDELETVSLIVTASDPSNLTSSLTITLQDGVLPADADYNLEQLEGNRARFTWNTTEADGPGVYDLVFGATNSVNAMSRETVQVTVAEVNEAPEFTQVFEEWTGSEDERLDLQFVATDGDLPANELVFDVFGNVPDGAEINATNGLLSWTPDENDGGQTFEFGVRVTDSGGLSAEHMIAITVAENQKAPVFDPISAQQVIEGEVLDFVVVAHDPDLPTHSIEFELEGDVPAGLSIDGQTGRVRWEVPEGYLPDSTLEATFELTIVAREVVTESEVAQTTKQTVEVTVVDRLADLVAATLTLAETAISDPMAGPTTVSLVSTTSDTTLETPVPQQMAETYDDRGFFGTQFGPTGAGGGGGSDQSEASDSDDETDGDTPSDGDQTSTLEQMLEEIADDMGEGVIEALLAAKGATDEAPVETETETESESAGEPEFVEERASSEEDSPETDRQVAADSEAELAVQEVAAGESTRS
jgi:cyclophilin family peptidyl-prolyl cis-trans isomerase